MAIIKKTLFPINLDRWSYYINDDLESSRYFKITELSDTFNGGKNGFRIQGSEYLAADSTISIEIKDSQGNVIYHEPVRGNPQYYEGTNIVVSVIVYPDTAFGPCTITIMGELATFETNGGKYPIPDEWLGRHNVRWQKRINVQPYHNNTTRIRFYKRPSVTIQEQTIPLYSKTTQTTTYTTFCSGSSVLGNPYYYDYNKYLTNKINSENITITTGSIFGPGSTLKEGSYYKIIQNGGAGCRFYDVGVREIIGAATGTNFYFKAIQTYAYTGSNNIIQPNVPALDDYGTYTPGTIKWPDTTGTVYLQEVFLNARSDYYIEFINPYGRINNAVSYDNGLTTNYPYLNVPDDLSKTYILDNIINENYQINITNIIGTGNYNGGSPGTRINAGGTDGEGIQYPDSSPVLARWNTTAWKYTQIGSKYRLYLNDSVSPIYADGPGYGIIDPGTFTAATVALHDGLGFINSFESADISITKTKDVYLQSGLSQSYAYITIKDLETFTGEVYKVKAYAKSRNDLQGYKLLDDIRLETNQLLLADSYLNNLNVRTGIFTTTDVISTFWNTTTLDGTTNLVYTINASSSFYSHSIYLEPSTIPSYKTDGLAKFETKNSFSFIKNTEYNLSYNLVCKSTPYGIASLDIYLSGSAFNNDNLTTQRGKSIGSHNFSNKIILDRQSINFVADNDGSGSLNFTINNGNWELSDISLTPYQQIAFSPNEFTFRIVPNQKIANETFDFKFEFYDINYALAPITVETAYTFVGGNNLSKRFLLQYASLVNPKNKFIVSNKTGGISGLDIAPNQPTLDISWVLSQTNGDVLFVSSAYDEYDNYILPSDVSSPYPYPGGLDYIATTQRSLTFQNFTSSLTNSSRRVKNIYYTASVDGLTQYFSMSADYTAAPLYVLPVVTTNAVYSINQTSVSGSGSVTVEPVTGHISPVEVGLVLNDTTAPTIFANIAKTSESSYTLNVPFSGSLTGLTPGTTYYVKAYASGSIGAAYGNELTFTTLPGTSSFQVYISSSMAGYSPTIQNIFINSGSLLFKNSAGLNVTYPLTGSATSSLTYSSSYYDIAITASQSFPLSKGHRAYLSLDRVNNNGGIAENIANVNIAAGTSSFVFTNDDGEPLNIPWQSETYIRLSMYHT